MMPSTQSENFEPSQERSLESSGIEFRPEFNREGRSRLPRAFVPNFSGSDMSDQTMVVPVLAALTVKQQKAGNHGVKWTLYQCTIISLLAACTMFVAAYAGMTWFFLSAVTQHRRLNPPNRGKWASGAKHECAAGSHKCETRFRGC
jgi:hypothetical protein